MIHYYAGLDSAISNIPIYGYIYDVKSGKLVEVTEATAAGKLN
jgi:carbonic anhydrase